MARRRRWRSGRAGADTRLRREGKEGDRVLERAHEGGREGKERGHGGDGVAFIGDAVGWGTGRGQRHAVVRRGVGGVLVGALRPAPKQGKAMLMSGAGTVTGGGFEFKK
jgi:hypothetical protein